jgi:hypothetical protein
LKTRFDGVKIIKTGAKSQSLGSLRFAGAGVAGVALPALKIFSLGAL